MKIKFEVEIDTEKEHDVELIEKITEFVELINNNQYHYEEEDA